LWWKFLPQQKEGKGRAFAKQLQTRDFVTLKNREVDPARFRKRSTGGMVSAAAALI
jgi:hypothetical protein